MSHIVIEQERCKGCKLCTLACPKNLIALSSHLNTQGYRVVAMTEATRNECLGCAFCAMVCPDAAITVWKSRRETTGGQS